MQRRQQSGYLCDQYGRTLNNLRLSVTQRCNFHCFFCHKEGELSPGHEMTPKEIEMIVKVASELGMNKVKLTGGESLLRKDILEIISRVSKHVSEVSLTTNGYFLKDQAQALRAAGLRRVNVSLHSTVPQTFAKITGIQGLHHVMEGIQASIAAYLDPVKVNVVVLKGINDAEIPPMIDFTAKHGAILQLIEFQPVHKDNVNPWNRYHYNLHEIEAWLEKRALQTIERKLHHRKQYVIQRDGGTARVEIVKPMHNSEFCQNCTRLRVTSAGKLKPCLLRNDNLIDVVSYLRGTSDLAGLKEAFQSAVDCREPYWKQ